MVVGVTQPTISAFEPVMATRVFVGMLALFLLAACQVPGSQPTCGNTIIDWVNFVKVGSIQYVAGPRVIDESELGPEFARVRFKVDGNVCDPNYRIKDGDAAFLEPGTPIYQVKGHIPTEELAARMNNTILVYLAIAPTS